MLGGVKELSKPLIAFACLTLLACGGARPVMRVQPPSLDTHETTPAEESAPAPTPTTTTTTMIAPEKAPPSTASYEQAVSKPEPIDINDDRIHLTDVQLNAPMRGVVSGCRMPANAHVTIKTAVQAGRAIGVTVNVRFDHGRSRRPLPPATLRAEAKISSKVAACVDRAVRVQTWPPSTRRDSFVTEF
jgi:hypothetical protein